MAKHFSSRWRRELANIHCNTINVALPPSAPSFVAQATSSGNKVILPNDAPATAPSVKATSSVNMLAPSIDAPAAAEEDTSPTPADKNAVTFIVQWMERGGADPIGTGSLLYPRGNLEVLSRLRDLVTSLEIDHLIARTNRDVAAIRSAFC